MLRRRRFFPWIAGAGVALGACNGSGGPLPAPGDGPANSNSKGEPTGNFAPTDGTALVGPAKSLSVPPAPLSGGTLLILKDGHTAIAADPDRDMIFVADTKSKRLLAAIPTKERSQPGRAVEDNEGNVHVVLREAGVVLKIKGGAWTIMAEQKVCPAPRGLAFDGARVWVACAGGELVEVSSAADRKSFKLDRDLRDVVASHGQLLVTQFRSAAVLTVSPEDGLLLGRTVPPGSRASQAPALFAKSEPPVNGSMSKRSSEPAVAWRMRPLRAGGAIMLHQEESTGTLGTDPGGYNGLGGCPGSSVVAAAVTTIDSDGTVSTSSQLPFSTLPIDIDVSRDGKNIAMIFAGNFSRSAPRGPVFIAAVQDLDRDMCGGASLPPDLGAGGSPGSDNVGGAAGSGGSGGDELPPPDVISASGQGHSTCCRRF
jgi:hypothetical protein